jgi:hypothetical protein
MPPGEFEPAIAASEQPQAYALDRAATGTGSTVLLASIKHWLFCATPMYKNLKNYI